MFSNHDPTLPPKKKFQPKLNFSIKNMVAQKNPSKKMVPPRTPNFSMERDGFSTKNISSIGEVNMVQKIERKKQKTHKHTLLSLIAQVFSCFNRISIKVLYKIMQGHVIRTRHLVHFRRLSYPLKDFNKGVIKKGTTIRKIWALVFLLCKHLI